MIQITKLNGDIILTGQLSICTSGGFTYLLHDGGETLLSEVQAIGVI